MPRLVDAPLPRRLTRAVALLDIPPLRLSLLLALHDHGGSASTRDLQEATGGKAVTVHRHLASLEQQGYVSRRHGDGPGNPPLVWRLDTAAVLAELDQLRAAFTD